MEFSDYIINYPLQDDPDIQHKTSRGLEFYELKGNAKEKVPKKGEFFNHQNLFSRYLKIYDRILNIHETGTGKTGSIITSAEMFKNDRSLGIDRVVIVLPGSATLDDFRSQLIKFFPEYGDKSLTMSNKKIDSWYSLETYETFAKNINRMSNDVIEETYSDTLFFFDEAHRLRNYTDSTTELNIYDYLWRLLHIAKRTKIVMATATPLVNSTNDFVPLVNLLLESDKQLPSTWDYDKVSLPQLEPYLRGKISFVRGLDTGVNVFKNGSNIRMNYKQDFPNESIYDPISPVKKEIIMDNSEMINRYKINSSPEPKQDLSNMESVDIEFNTNLTLLQMSYKDKTPTLQQKGYENSLNTNSAFNANERQASIMVYPDGSYGSEGFKRYVKKDGDKYLFKDRFMDSKGVSQKGLTSYLDKKDIYSLFNFSNKFWYYIGKEMKSSGNSFCYIEPVTGSGLITLDLLLQFYGFEKYTGTHTPKLDENKKRFAVITGDTKNINSILKVFNSPENRDGEIIQMIVASEVARDGINLANVVRGYLMTPTWHESGSHQALSRFIRATSHQELLKREGKVDVKIYKLCSCIDIEYVKKTIFDVNSLETLSKNSIDVKNYIRSGIKDISNKRTMQKFKKIAFDGVLNYNRNYNRESDKDYSKKLDFNLKNPKMWSAENVEEHEVNKNIKHLLYNQNNLNTIQEFVIEGLNTNGAVTLNEIKDHISNKFEQINLYLYLDSMVNKIDIKDKFGNQINVKFVGSVIYTDSYSDHIYNLNVKNYLPKIENVEYEAKDQEMNEIKTSIRGKNYEETEKIIRDFIWVTDKTGKGIKDVIVKRFKILRKLLEESIINLKNENTNQEGNNILKLFGHYIGRVDYPNKDVEMVKNAFEKTDLKSGRKAAQTSKTKLKGLQFEDKMNTNINTVYYHWFDTVETSKVTDIYNTLENKMRICMKDSNEFRDTTENEKYAFFHFMDQDREKMFEKYDKNNFGSILRDSKFRLHIYKEGIRNKGTECKGKKIVIINFFISVIDTVRDKGKLSELFGQDILNNMENNKMLFEYINMTINPTSIVLCNKLEEFLDYKGLLLRSL